MVDVELSPQRVGRALHLWGQRKLVVFANKAAQRELFGTANWTYTDYRKNCIWIVVGPIDVVTSNNNRKAIVVVSTRLGGTSKVAPHFSPPIR